MMPRSRLIRWMILTKVAKGSGKQGLTLVHFSAQLKHYLWATLLHVPARREHMLLHVVVASIDKNVSG